MGTFRNPKTLNDPPPTHDFDRAQHNVLTINASPPQKPAVTADGPDDERVIRTLKSVF